MIDNESRKNLGIETFVDPRSLPEMGFQSYEMLKNDATTQKATFLANEMRNPELTYPHLSSLAKMDNGILRLHDAIERVKHTEPDDEKGEITVSSLEFRMAEMEYIKLLGRLDFVNKEDGPIEEIVELTEEARALGEQLYGVPDGTLYHAALGEVWSQLDSKSLSTSAQYLYDDLSKGFLWEGKDISPLPRPDSVEALPDFNNPAIKWAGEIILANNADLEAYFRTFWEQKVAENGPDYTAHPPDIAEAYQGAFGLIDPENEASIDVILDPEASALSWESPLMAVKVGGKRAPIRTAEELFHKFLHEGKGHGGRAINGLKTGLPVLGTGLYTNTPRADYLTFEEGFCTTIEEAVSGSEPRWSGANMGHYINIALASEGGDFRSVFETAWRYRLLMKLEDEQDVGEKMIEKEQKLAYTALVRIFRGTPTALQERHPDTTTPLTFNKDLAYLNGRVLAMNHISELYQGRDEDGLMQLFQAKYDPTIPEQQAIIDRYCQTDSAKSA